MSHISNTIRKPAYVNNKGADQPVHLCSLINTFVFYEVSLKIWEAQWPSGRASDSGARGQGFDPHSGISQKVLVIPRKRWLCPNMTEKLFTGTLSKNERNKSLKILVP